MIDMMLGFGRPENKGSNTMKNCGALLCASILSAFLTAALHAQGVSDCFGEDIERRIKGCTALIEGPNSGEAELGAAYAARGLAFSMKGENETAINDYDMAIKLNPNSAVALNNRAWAHFRLGKAEAGLPDVERSLQLAPTSPDALDTRAHIRQVLDQSKAALNDYTKAMFFGGQRMIKLYQCGLTEAGLYTGEIDGLWRRELQTALEQCVLNKVCDPLPADSQCRAATS